MKETLVTLTLREEHGDWPLEPGCSSVGHSISLNVKFPKETP